MLGHRALNAQDYIAILKRRWWILLLPTLLMPVVTGGLTYFLTPEYESTSLILIEQPKVASDVVKPLDLGNLNERLGLNTAQIESRSTLEPIITKYNLYANQHLSMEMRVEMARKKLDIKPIESQIAANGLPGFKVTFKADDPRTAQQICADITGLYTQNNLLDQQNMTAGTKAFVQSELDEETRKLNDIEQKVADFKAKNLGALPGDESGTANILSSLGARLDATNQTITNLQQSRQVLEMQLSQAKALAAPAAAVAVKAQETNETELEKAQADLANLQMHYTDDYPDVKAAKRRVADLQAQIAKAASAPPVPVVSTPATHVDSPEVTKLNMQLKLIDETIAQRTKDQADIQTQMRSYQGRMNASPQVEAQYEELTRDLQTEQATYNKLLQQSDQSGMATELQNRQEGESFTVLDAASLPIDPTFPKQSVFVLSGVVAGIALGIGIIALLEYRDTALRSERDVWAFTQLPTLAVIAYSADVAHTQPPPGFLKRLFKRKTPQPQLAG